MADGSRLHSVYLHVDRNASLNEGDPVRKDTQIGKIANRPAAHLHFEVRTKSVASEDLYENDSNNTGYYSSFSNLRADGFKNRKPPMLQLAGNRRTMNTARTIRSEMPE